MISIRKDYSYKYNHNSNSSIASTVQKGFRLPLSPPQPPPANVTKLRRESTFIHKRESPSAAVKSSSISILERYDYDKTKLTYDDKFAKIDNNPCSPVNESAILTSIETPTVAEVATLVKPTPTQTVKKKKKSKSDHSGGGSSSKKKAKVSELPPQSTTESTDQLKVIVKTEPIDVKPPSSVPSSPQQQQQPENINKINNKINIIFQLNNDRKNIIWHHHRRAPKKNLVQKITIKEANNNTTAVEPPQPKLTSVETQTEPIYSMNLSSSNPLIDEPVEFMFFEDEVLLCLQRNTITFYEFNRLATLLRKGEPDFKLIDAIPRRLHDHQIDADNKFQRLCYNEQNTLPIYVEMRAKQKPLDDPLAMAPIAFSYCNVYYIDLQGSAKFSSVHLDTVKSTHSDIVYTCIPGTSYFIMAWNEAATETKSTVTGIVKYKLTPNLDLAKLASIRQFPKLNYRTKQVYCGNGENSLEYEERSLTLSFCFHLFCSISTHHIRRYASVDLQL